MRYDKENLWNVDVTTNKRKTRNVVTYINNLSDPPESSSKVLQKFNRIRREALDNTTADAMLTRIGFELTKEDGIYGECLEEDKRDGKR